LRLPAIVEKCGVKLVILDSIAAVFRAETYGVKASGVRGARAHGGDSRPHSSHCQRPH